jgi:hypothetical protein
VGLFASQSRVKKIQIMVSLAHHIGMFIIEKLMLCFSFLFNVGMIQIVICKDFDIK